MNFFKNIFQGIQSFGQKAVRAIQQAGQQIVETGKRIVSGAQQAIQRSGNALLAQTSGILGGRRPSPQPTPQPQAQTQQPIRFQQQPSFTIPTAASTPATATTSPLSQLINQTFEALKSKVVGGRTTIPQATPQTIDQLRSFPREALTQARDFSQILQQIVQTMPNIGSLPTAASTPAFIPSGGGGVSLPQSFKKEFQKTFLQVTGLAPSGGGISSGITKSSVTTMGKENRILTQTANVANILQRIAQTMPDFSALPTAVSTPAVISGGISGGTTQPSLTQTPETTISRNIGGRPVGAGLTLNPFTFTGTETPEDLERRPVKSLTSKQTFTIDKRISDLLGQMDLEKLQQAKEVFEFAQQIAPQYKQSFEGVLTELDKQIAQRVGQLNIEEALPETPVIDFNKLLQALPQDLLAETQPTISEQLTSLVDTLQKNLGISEVLAQEDLILKNIRGINEIYAKEIKRIEDNPELPTSLAKRRIEVLTKEYDARLNLFKDQLTAVKEILDRKMKLLSETLDLYSKVLTQQMTTEREQKTQEAQTIKTLIQQYYQNYRSRNVALRNLLNDLIRTKGIVYLKPSELQTMANELGIDVSFLESMKKSILNNPSVQNVRSFTDKEGNVTIVGVSNGKPVILGKIPGIGKPSGSTQQSELGELIEKFEQLRSQSQQQQQQQKKGILERIFDIFRR